MVTVTLIPTSQETSSGENEGVAWGRKLVRVLEGKEKKRVKNMRLKSRKPEQKHVMLIIHTQ